MQSFQNNNANFNNPAIQYNDQAFNMQSFQNSNANSNNPAIQYNNQAFNMQSFQNNKANFNNLTGPPPNIRIKLWTFILIDSQITVTTSTIFLRLLRMVKTWTSISIIIKTSVVSFHHWMSNRTRNYNKILSVHTLPRLTLLPPRLRLPSAIWSIIQDNLISSKTTKIPMQTSTLHRARNQHESVDAQEIRDGPQTHRLLSQQKVKSSKRPSRSANRPTTVSWLYQCVTEY